MKKKIPIYIALPLMLLSCGTMRHTYLTGHLFLQPGRISIAHHGGEQGGGTPGAARVLAEQVNYTAGPLPDEVQTAAGNEDGRLDTTRVYALEQVTVVSKARFTTVREGLVNLDFVIRVPKEFLSDDYQVCLTPELLHNDSLVKLEEVVLRGKNFVSMQEEDYRRFEAYMTTIVDPAGYDTAFINRRAVDRELERRRKNELGNYYNNWTLLQEYIGWKDREQQKYDRYNIARQARLNEKLEAHDGKYRRKLTRALVLRRDTAQLGQEYRARRRKLISEAPARRQITLGTVPTEYREFYLGNVTQENLNALMPGKEDSIRIAREHVMQERVALNEVKSSRAQETFERMVPYPYKPDAHYSAPIAGGHNFNYRYTRQYPVTGNLKSLKLTLKGYIAATDRSRYNFSLPDTLSFIISSMDELADGSLVANKNFTPGQRSEYTHALQLLRNREYRRALEILNAYKDYNTALVLACMGYDKQAGELLAQLEKNANTLYLSAILNARLGAEHQAVENLKQACRLDEKIVFRTGKDPDISRLVHKYGLADELL